MSNGGAGWVRVLKCAILRGILSILRGRVYGTLRVLPEGAEGLRYATGLPGGFHVFTTRFVFDGRSEVRGR